MTIPDAETARRVIQALAGRGYDASIGGSGLLAALGLADHVRDWDVTTDAPQDVVLDTLRDLGLTVTALPCGDPPFATKARFSVDAGDHTVDGRAPSTTTASGAGGLT